MENRMTILNELRAISPVVADIHPGTPYLAPEGYFVRFPGEILKRLAADEDTVSYLLPGNFQVYQVPHGYFEGLAMQVMRRINTREESTPESLQEARSNPYDAPQGYFDSLPAAILNRIRAVTTEDAGEELEMISPLLSKISKKTPFSTPEGYFNDLTGNAIAGAKAIDFVNDELENLPPVLASLRDKQVYETPKGYFGQLPGAILGKVSEVAKPANVVSMNFTRRVMRYAVAAVVAGIILTTGWFLKNGNNGTDPGPDETGIAKVDVNSISNEVAELSDDALENYLDNQTYGAEVPVVASYEIDAEDMKEMLADVSDEELQQYVEKFNLTNEVYTN